MMFSRDFWRGTSERVIRTIAQTLISVAVLGPGFNLFEIAWEPVLGVALGAGAMSFLTSVISQPFGDPTSPSVLNYGRHSRKD